MNLYELNELNRQATEDEDPVSLRFSFSCDVDAINKDSHSYRTVRAARAAIKSLYSEYVETYAVVYGSKARVKRILTNPSHWYDHIYRD